MKLDNIIKIKAMIAKQQRYLENNKYNIYKRCSNKFMRS